MKKDNLILSKVISDSMSPLIHRGDVIKVKPCDIADVKIGDIIFFKISPREMPGKNGKTRYSFVVHRAVDRKIVNNKECLLQKGDASVLSPLPVFYEQIKGKVIFIEKKNYDIDLSRIKWKIANRVFAIRAILEYRFDIIFQTIFKFLPKRIMFHFERRFFYAIRKIQQIVLLAFLPFLRMIYVRK